MEGLANAIVDARKNVRYCKECCTLTDQDVCPDVYKRQGYTPENMNLSRYTVDEQQRQATLFYQYGDEVVRYFMYLNDDDSSFGQKEVDKEIDKYTETCGDITIEVKVYQAESTGRLRYVAKFERDVYKRQGQRVPAIKTSENWSVSLAELPLILSSDKRAEVKETEKGLSLSLIHI